MQLIDRAVPTAPNPVINRHSAQSLGAQDAARSNGIALTSSPLGIKYINVLTALLLEMNIS